MRLSEQWGNWVLHCQGIENFDSEKLNWVLLAGCIKTTEVPVKQLSLRQVLNQQYRYFLNSF